VKLTPEQIDHARKLPDKGEARQYLADLLNLGRSTLYRAPNSQFSRLTLRCPLGRSYRHLAFLFSQLEAASILIRARNVR
jgi:hypothetical protein